MDARIEKLLKRDANGIPLILSQEEINTLANRFGSKAVQQASQEIIAQHNAAKAESRKQAQEDADRATAATRAQADIETRRAETARQGQASAAAAAREKAEAERVTRQSEAEKARRDAETAALAAAGQHKEDLNTAMADYRKTGLSDWTSAASAASPFIGAGAGYGLAGKIQPVQSRYETANNAERQKLASAFDAIDPASPTARAEYQSVADAAKRASLVPSATSAGSVIRGAKRYIPYGVTGAGLLAEGALSRYLGSDPEKTPFNQDALTAAGQASMLSGASLSAIGAKYAMNPAVIPDADALRKIALADKYANAPEATVTPPSTTRAPAPEPPLHLEGKTPTEASREILARLGIPSSKGLADNMDLIRENLPKASPALRDALAASHADFNPNDLDTSVIKRVGGRPFRRLALPLAVGAGAAGAALSSGESEAGGLPSGGPSKDESLTSYRLRQLGLPSTASEATNTASYFAPWVGPARFAADIGTGLGDVTKAALAAATRQRSVIDMPPPKPSRTSAFPNPNSPKGMADAARYAPALAEDARQRDELAPPHPELGATAAAATPKNGGVSDYRDIAKGPVTPGVQPSAHVPFDEMGFDPAHLPDYERGLLEKGIHPSEAAMHLMPHARAGAEAVRRGEDFWGGSDQFERERNALQKFYSMANAHANAVIGKPSEEMFGDIPDGTP